MIQKFLAATAKQLRSKSIAAFPSMLVSCQLPTLNSALQSFQTYGYLPNTLCCFSPLCLRHSSHFLIPSLAHLVNSLSVQANLIHEIFPHSPRWSWPRPSSVLFLCNGSFHPSGYFKKIRERVPTNISDVSHIPDTLWALCVNSLCCLHNLSPIRL